MYDVALQAFVRLDGVESDQDLAASLNSLKEPLRELRRGYKGDRVRVQYERGSELAYLLAYVPASIRMAEQVIVRTLAPGDVRETLRLGIVGAGPAPEAVAMVNLLTATPTSCRRIELHLFDIATDEWQDVRRCLLDVGCVERWSGTIEPPHVHEVDLRSPGAFAQYRSLLQGLDYVLVQNCLNEDVAHRADSIANLRDLATAIPPAAVLAVADQLKYDVVRDQLRMLADALDEEVEVFGRFEAPVGTRVRDSLPAVLVAELLTEEDGLMARKKLDFGVLAVRAPERVPSLWSRLRGPHRRA